MKFCRDIIADEAQQRSLLFIFWQSILKSGSPKKKAFFDYGKHYLLFNFLLQEAFKSGTEMKLLSAGVFLFEVFTVHPELYIIFVLLFIYFQTSLCNYCRPPNNELSLGVCVAMFSAAVTSIVIVVLSLRWFGKVAFF